MSRSRRSRSASATCGSPSCASENIDILGTDEDPP
eukprot:CAMPEP_0197577490 /NCGR_PEP_ID=MMETSP1326-20131121/2102_1 /TAXON_ID=1155430 /ORGANISM="Genus nov. species nov., Strain RCC2288" /LENGTH=34 /DNA_ID= /DNA_START= /DNA_END= /DNA_ORIENTATION=